MNNTTSGAGIRHGAMPVTRQKNMRHKGVSMNGKMVCCGLVSLWLGLGQNSSAVTNQTSAAVEAKGIQGKLIGTWVMKETPSLVVGFDGQQRMTVHGMFIDPSRPQGEMSSPEKVGLKTFFEGKLIFLDNDSCKNGKCFVRLSSVELPCDVIITGDKGMLATDKVFRLLSVKDDEMIVEFDNPVHGKETLHYARLSKTPVAVPHEWKETDVNDLVQNILTVLGGAK